MRAVRFSRFGGPEVLEIVDLPDPRPGAGEIRVKVRAAGINASDWKKRQGLMDQELPQTLGCEAASSALLVGGGLPVHRCTRVTPRLCGGAPGCARD